ncbi:MAG: glycosyltransferase family 4 protein [Roseiflexaceae bacterium]|nr:glycosyltransferase family 4 protein [Roseiflexaceae bacterium]
MHILILGLGGVTRQFHNWPERTLGQALVAAGHQVTAITYHQPAQPHLGLNERVEQIDGITVYRVTPTFFPAIELLNLLRILPRIDLAHGLHPRNVLAFQAVRWLKSRGVPVVWTWLGPYHDRWLVDDRERPYEVAPHPERLIYTPGQLARRIAATPSGARELLRNYAIHAPMRQVDAFLPCSDHEARVLRDQLGFTNILPTVPLWLDMDFMHGAAPPLDVQLTEPIIPYIGQLTVRKCYDMVVDAMPAVVARYPAASFVFVTHNPEQREQLQALAAQHGVAANLHFLGAISEAQKLALLRASDVLPFPSRYEGFGLPLLEGMAAGTPVISTDIPVVNEIVRDGENGLLVPYDDSAALAAAMLRVLDEPALRAKLVAGGTQAIAERFAPSALVGEVLAGYEQVRTGKR